MSGYYNEPDNMIDNSGEDWSSAAESSMASQHYCLRWNNYQSNMTSVFHHLLRTEAFVDVTLACNENSLKAHKVVLSACSSYFQKLLIENPCKHPTIIMPQDVCFNDLKFIIEFVYRGEIDVSQAELQSLLKTADQLKIKGLCEVPERSNKEGTPTAEVTPLPPVQQSTSPIRGRNTKLQRRMSGTKRRFNEQYPNNNNKRSNFYGRDTKPHQVQSQIIQTSVTADMLDSNAAQDNSLQPMTNCMTVATSTEEENDCKGNIELSVLNLDQPPQSQQPQPVLHENGHGHSTPHTQHENRLVMTSPAPIMSTTHTPPSTMQPHTLQPMTNCMTVATSTDEENDCKANIELSVLSLDQPQQGQQPPPQQQQQPPQQQQQQQQQQQPVHDNVMSLDQGPQSQQPTPQPVPHENDHGHTTPHSQENRLVMTSPALIMSTTLTPLTTIQPHSFSVLQNPPGEDEHTMHTMMITPELLGLIPSSSGQSDVSNDSKSGVVTSGTICNKAWTQEDMDMALEALRNHNMSLTKASITYGIPSTTLWQRAHRMGIDTPKKDGPNKSWNEDILNVALEALRNGSISANKASKAYGIPSSTLYKIARREGIRLAQPFNAAPTTWNPDDLERALEAIRSGQTTVQRAATEYGIPSGTLYGRCKREGIELSRSNPTPWSEDAMLEALEAVRMGQMSINQAAIHYNLPYSSLYGRFKRGKYEADHPDQINVDSSSPPAQQQQTLSPMYFV